MARNKHSAALFEVIHSDKRFRNKSSVLDLGGSLKTPKWWFKGRDKSEAAPAVAASQPTPDEIAADPTLAAGREPATPAPKTVKLNPERSEISFKLTYTTAIIGAFTVVVIIGLAYMFGTRGKPAPAAARAGQSTESLLLQSPQTGVLNLEQSSKGTPAGGNSQAAPSKPAAAPTPSQAGSQAPATAQQPAAPVEDEKFVIGRNYVIAQIYPDEKSAQQAAEALIKGGVPVKVVRGPKGWASLSWYSVIGTRGFERLRNNPEYDAYVQRIVDIGAPFSKDPKFKKLDPHAFKWQAAY